MTLAVRRTGTVTATMCPCPHLETRNRHRRARRSTETIVPEYRRGKAACRTPTQLALALRPQASGWHQYLLPTAGPGSPGPDCARLTLAFETLADSPDRRLAHDAMMQCCMMHDRSSVSHPHPARPPHRPSLSMSIHYLSSHLHLDWTRNGGGVDVGDRAPVTTRTRSHALTTAYRCQVRCMLHLRSQAHSSGVSSRSRSTPLKPQVPAQIVVVSAPTQ